MSPFDTVFENCKKKFISIYNKEMQKLNNSNKPFDSYNISTSITNMLNKKSETSDDFERVIYIALVFRLLATNHGLFLISPDQTCFSKFKENTKQKLLNFHNQNNILHCKRFYKKLFNTNEDHEFKIKKKKNLKQHMIVFDKLIKYSCKNGYFYKDKLKI